MLDLMKKLEITGDLDKKCSGNGEVEGKTSTGGQRRSTCQLFMKIMVLAL
jgi:hypothetical protein